MNGRRRSRWWQWCSLALVGLFAGCAIERPGVSASSNAPFPWFNFQVAPAKKDSSNYQRSISRTTTERVTVRPAMAEPIKEVRRPEWRLPGTRREALALPRTDDQPRPKVIASRSTDDVHIEFD